MCFYLFLFITLSLSAAQSKREELVAKMSVEQKIGQLFMVAAVSDEKLNEAKVSPYKTDHAYVSMLINNYYVGGVIFIGVATKETLQNRVSAFQKMSDTPLLIGLDAEWGVGMRVTDGRNFEKNNLLGLKSDDEVEAIGKLIGADCKELGVHINFAPVVDVNTNSVNPVIGARSFGDNPDTVVAKAIAYMRGLHSAGILACAKHFPGHGDTDIDSHYALPVLHHNKERLRAVELLPFKRMIAEDVDAIMVGHLSVPALDPSGIPATFSRLIIEGLLRGKENFEGMVVSDVIGHPTLTKPQIQELLRKQMSFNGLVVTDGLGMQALTNEYEPGDLELRALLAGNDLLLCPVDVPEAVKNIKEAIQTQALSMQELDEHVMRVLHAKEKVGLLL